MNSHFRKERYWEELARIAEVALHYYHRTQGETRK
jgi:hypothetical protein